MGNRGNGEGSTDFLKLTYLSGSMNNGIIDTKSSQGSSQNSEGREKVPVDWGSREKPGLAVSVLGQRVLCFAILKSYNKSFDSQAFGNETRNSTGMSWHRCVLVGVVQECGLLSHTAWFPPQLHHLPRKAWWVTESHSACFLRSNVGLIIVLINLSTKCPVHVKYLSQYLARGKSPLSPHRRHCHPIAAVVRAVASALGKKRLCAGAREPWVCLGTLPSGSGVSPSAEGGRVAWSGLSSPPALWYTWIRHFMLGTQLFQWTFQRQIKGLFVKPFELHWVVLWERFCI